MPDSPRWKALRDPVLLPALVFALAILLVILAVLAPPPSPTSAVGEPSAATTETP